MAYGTRYLDEPIQTEDNEVYLKTNHELIQFETNQVYGTANHEHIQTECNQAYTLDHKLIITEQNQVYASADHDASTQMTQNQAYVPTNPEKIEPNKEKLKSVQLAPSTSGAATIDQEKQGGNGLEQHYEQISLNEDSEMTQQGDQRQRSDETYDYINCYYS